MEAFLERATCARANIILATRIGKALTARGMTVAAAESCTGGLLMSFLTDVAGSSAYIAGGITSYTDAVKANVLGVSKEDLAMHTAVSGIVAQQMALGVRHVMGTDIGLSITGYAGPGGGTQANPVGTVFMGFADANGTAVAHALFPAGDRYLVKLHAVMTTLRLFATHMGLDTDVK